MKVRNYSKRYYLMRHERTWRYDTWIEMAEHMRSRKRMKVRVYTLDEAEALMADMMCRGYEGVQNESYRYCRESAEVALESGCCYICNTGGSIYVANGHDPNRKNFLDVSKSKFILELDSRCH